MKPPAAPRGTSVVSASLKWLGSVVRLSPARPLDRPGESFFAILQLYNSVQPFFDKTWRPSEIETN
jgi:hypothetical protein